MGQGNIGEKARQLIEKTLAIEEVGLMVPNRCVLAEDFFDSLFQSLNLGKNLSEISPDDSLESLIEGSSLTSQQILTLQEVKERLKSPYLAVRSSAEGDSRGTGTYHSEFITNPADLPKAVTKVLASYFSQNAITFREKAQTGKGFGIIIEPIVEQQLQKRKFDDIILRGPVYSGFGYTSTSKGGGYIKIVPGLFGGVSNKRGVTLGEFDLSCGGDWYFKLLQLSEKVGCSGEYHPHRALFQYARGHCIKEGKFSDYDMSLFDRKVERQLFRLDTKKIGQVLQRMKLLEERFGTPQYFEFAMTLQDKKPIYWITQIADVSLKTDVFDFGYDNIKFDCDMVTGSGDIKCQKIVRIDDHKNYGALRKFNQENDNYVLIYPDSLVTGANPFPKMQFYHYSNAKVMIEFGAGNHEDPISHLAGQADMAGKFVGSLYFDRLYPDWDWLDDNSSKQEGLLVYDGGVRVIASEKQDRMIVIP